MGAPKHASIAAVMKADDVLTVLGALRQVGVECWLDGGWGIDA
jgi:hypothetical protein